VRVARLHDRGNVQLHEEARPEPADGMSLVRVTDVGLRHQRPPARRARIPCTDLGIREGGFGTTGLRKWRASSAGDEGGVLVPRREIIRACTP